MRAGGVFRRIINPHLKRILEEIDPIADTDKKSPCEIGVCMPLLSPKVWDIIMLLSHSPVTENLRNGC